MAIVVSVPPVAFGIEPLTLASVSVFQPVDCVIDGAAG
jgi:hypothetical protein